MRNVILLMVLAVSVILPRHPCSASGQQHQHLTQEQIRQLENVSEEQLQQQLQTQLQKRQRNRIGKTHVEPAPEKYHQEQEKQLINKLHAKRSIPIPVKEKKNQDERLDSEQLEESLGKGLINEDQLQPKNGPDYINEEVPENQEQLLEEQQIKHPLFFKRSAPGYKSLQHKQMLLDNKVPASESKEDQAANEIDRSIEQEKEQSRPLRSIEDSKRKSEQMVENHSVSAPQESESQESQYQQLNENSDLDEKISQTQRLNEKHSASQEQNPDSQEKQFAEEISESKIEPRQELSVQAAEQENSISKERSQSQDKQISEEEVDELDPKDKEEQSRILRSTEEVNLKTEQRNENQFVPEQNPQEQLQQQKSNVQLNENVSGSMQHSDEQEQQFAKQGDEKRSVLEPNGQHKENLSGLKQRNLLEPLEEEKALKLADQQLINNPGLAEQSLNEQLPQGKEEPLTTQVDTKQTFPEEGFQTPEPVITNLQSNRNPSGSIQHQYAGNGELPLSEKPQEILTALELNSEPEGQHVQLSNRELKENLLGVVEQPSEPLLAQEIKSQPLTELDEKCSVSGENLLPQEPKLEQLNENLSGLTPEQSMQQQLSKDKEEQEIANMLDSKRSILGQNSHTQLQQPNAQLINPNPSELEQQSLQQFAAKGQSQINKQVVVKVSSPSQKQLQQPINNLIEKPSVLVQEQSLQPQPLQEEQQQNIQSQDQLSVPIEQIFQQQQRKQMQQQNDQHIRENSVVSVKPQQSLATPQQNTQYSPQQPITREPPMQQLLPKDQILQQILTKDQPIQQPITKEQQLQQPIEQPIEQPLPQKKPLNENSLTQESLLKQQPAKPRMAINNPNGATITLGLEQGQQQVPRLVIQSIKQIDAKPSVLNQQQQPMAEQQLQKQNIAVDEKRSIPTEDELPEQNQSAEDLDDLTDSDENSQLDMRRRHTFPKYRQAREQFLNDRIGGRRTMSAQQYPHRHRHIDEEPSDRLESRRSIPTIQRNIRRQSLQPLRNPEQSNARMVKSQQSRNRARQIDLDTSATQVSTLPILSALPGDIHWQNNLHAFPQNQFDDDFPLWHSTYDTMYRPVNRVQPAPSSKLVADVQRQVAPESPAAAPAPAPPAPPEVKPPNNQPTQPTQPTQLTQSSQPSQPGQPGPPGQPAQPGQPSQPPVKQSSSSPHPPPVMTSTTSPLTNPKAFEMPPMKDSSVSQKQGQLQKLVQELYQAEAQVQLEAQQIQQAQAVAAASQQTLEEAANNVKVISAALQSAQEAVASAAIRAHIAQLQLAAHDQMLFTARQNVDSLSAQMVGLQAQVGIQYDINRLNVPELMGRLQQPLSADQTPTPIPTLIPLNVQNEATSPAPNSNPLQQLLDESNAGVEMTAHVQNNPEYRPYRRYSSYGLEGVIPNDQLPEDPTSILNGLQQKYRNRRDIQMLIDELRKPLVHYYKRENK